jgi:SAM-dependent methyltransferase
MPDDRLFAGNKLDLGALAKVATRPPLFAPHASPFWNDPHISEQMLAAHLDPSRDAASRRPEVIDRTVDWLISYLRLGAGCRVLDLGCGPGLYCERLAHHNLEVVGVDFSPRSIDYARRNADREHLDIEYLCQDYTRLDRDAEFDAVFLIYYDFGVLSDGDRDEVLRRVHRALKPGGVFAFDVITANTTAASDGVQSWSVSAGGFWKPGPYLELTQHFCYPESNARVRQTIVVDVNGRLSCYRIWEHWYSRETVTVVLAKAGFVMESIWSDLTGRPFEPSSPSLGVVARRP